MPPQRTSRPSSPKSADLQLRYLMEIMKDPKLKHRPLSEDQLFILLNAKLQFNWENKKFEIVQSDELMADYHKRYKDFDYHKNLSNLEIFLNRTFDYPAHVFIKIHKPPKWQRQDPSSIQEMFYAYSPYRAISKEKDIMTIIKNILSSYFMDEMIKKSLQDVYGSYERMFDTLPLKFSEIGESAGYLRDDMLTLWGSEKVYQPDERLIELYRKKLKVKACYLSFSKPYKVCAADFAKSAVGETAIERIPFFVEGGNVVTGFNKRGEKIMIIASSDKDFDWETKEFLGAYFLEKDGSISFCNHLEYAKKIEKWGNDLGFRTIVVERNILWPFSVLEMYHLDVFVNIIDGNLLIPADTKDVRDGRIYNILTADSLTKLSEAFDVKDIIKLSNADRKNLAANSIVFGKVAIVSHPDISEKFIGDLCNRGICVVVPPIVLGIFGDKSDGIRCHTQRIFKDPKTQASSAEAFLIDVGKQKIP